MSLVNKNQSNQLTDLTTKLKRGSKKAKNSQLTKMKISRQKAENSQLTKLIYT